MINFDLERVLLILTIICIRTGSKKCTQATTKSVCFSFSEAQSTLTQRGVLPVLGRHSDYFIFLCLYLITISKDRFIYLTSNLTFNFLIIAE